MNDGGGGADPNEESPLAALPASAPVLTPPRLFNLGIPPLNRPSKGGGPPNIGTGGAPPVGGRGAPPIGTGGAPPGTGGAPECGGRAAAPGSPTTRPPVCGALRSFVTVFFNLAPLRISPKRASRFPEPIGGPAGFEF